MVKYGADAGFTLFEMMIALAITSIVGLGAVIVLTGTVSSQKKLEKLLEKGFGTITYRSNGFPLTPPNLVFKARTGWIRVPSTRAWDPLKKIFSGSFVTPTLTVMVNAADSIVDTPTWSLCASDETVVVTCSEFVDGQATIVFKLNKPLPPEAAVVRVRVQWPKLPDGHINKSSPEYVFSVPYVRDCDLDLPTPGAPFYLEHGMIYFDPGPIDPPGTCRTAFKRYECSNGKLNEILYEKACP